MKSCIFCKIVNKEIPAEIVYENENVIAFNDINPATPIHILVLPKKHIDSSGQIESSDSNLIGEIFLVIKEIAKLNGFLENGYRVITNCGEDGGQSVKHLHFHILAGKKLGEKII